MKQRRADILVEIDRLAYGGDGVGRDASGRVVFVPHTAPGDAVRAIVHQESARFAKAKLTSIVTAGAARVAPPCPYVHACGGCTWQHVSYEAQADAKRSAAAFALRRFVAAGTDIEWVGMTQTTAWRRRARFHFRRTDEAFYLGFFAPQTHRVVDIAACVQLVPALSQLIAGLRTVLSDGPPGSGDIAVLEGLGGALHIAISGVADAHILAQLIEMPNVVGVTSYGAGKDSVLGQPHVELDPGVFASARDFAQAGREANVAMRAAVVRAAGAGQGQSLLELYAGAGNFSAPLVAAGWHVVANDLATPAMPLAGVTFVAQDAVEFVETLVAEQRTFRTVVLDPPRAGALATVELLPALGATRIVYVSCDVMTLARDAAILLGSGFTLPQVVVIDAMPQTSHFEVVATFVRANS